jgi:hypothetical protein
MKKALRNKAVQSMLKYVSYFREQSSPCEAKLTVTHMVIIVIATASTRTYHEQAWTNYIPTYFS